MHFDVYHLYILAIVLVALGFDFINGFHDAANAIATVVSTRALTPRAAVIWAAFFNILAAFFVGTAVAATMGKGIVSPDIIDPNLILAALAGAVIWNLVTWYWGLPSSSSHALIGGLAGAGLVKAGLGALILWEDTGKSFVFKGILGISIYIVVAPLLAFLFGLILMTVIAWVLRGIRPAKVDRVFKWFQYVSSAVYSFSHGSNDAQKTMGIVYALLIAAGLGHWAHAADVAELKGRLLEPQTPRAAWVMQTEDGSHVEIEGTDGLKTQFARQAESGEPTVVYGKYEKLKTGNNGFKQQLDLAWWIIGAAHLAIGLGTYMGGWRIVKTMGSKITKLRPSNAFCAEAGGGITILLMSAFGIPVSTTHTITGAIVGVGTTRRFSAVRWGVARTVVWAWVVTIPAAALVAALAYLPFKLLGH